METILQKKVTLKSEKKSYAQCSFGFLRLGFEQGLKLELKLMKTGLNFQA